MPCLITHRLLIMLLGPRIPAESVLDLFIEPNHDFWPLARNVWLNALEASQREFIKAYERASGLSPPLETMAPAPSLFNNAQRWSTTIGIWLAVRPLWFSKCVANISANGIVTPRPHKEWKNLFSAHEALLRGPLDDAAMNSVQLQAVRNALDPNANANHRIAPIQRWRDVDVDCRQPIPAGVAAGIIAEVYDVNFRLDLLALDSILLPDRWTGSVANFHRLPLVAAVFPHAAFVGTATQELEPGLCHERGIRRLPFILNFRKLLSSWPDFQADWSDFVAPTVFESGGDLLPRDRIALEVLEGQLAGFYCNHFVKAFLRPPVIPHRYL